MKFFNIQYECNDARDGFSKQIQKGIQSNAIFPQWFSSDMMDELNNDLDYDEDTDFVNFDNNNSSNPIKYVEPGKKGITKLNQMQEISIENSTKNDVKIIDNLFRSFKAATEEAQQIINEMVKYFNLNKDQERAFHIVANHAVTSASEQLKMYLGGMGGTGKLQVIKVPIHFFNIRNESHCFVVLGPTGSSAALLNGSTYHSFLDIFITGDISKMKTQI